MNLIEHFIDGKTTKGFSKKISKVFNPATGNQESEVMLGAKKDLDLSVQAAKKAFELWSNKPPLQLSLIHI